ncbi:hypothetical protein Tco_1024856 [Tanacetum coccineum]
MKLVWDYCIAISKKFIMALKRESTTVDFKEYNPEYKKEIICWDLNAKYEGKKEDNDVESKQENRGLNEFVSECLFLGFLELRGKLAHPNLSDSFRRYPRGGAEFSQFGEFSALMHQVIRAPMADRWMWTRNSSGEFTVASKIFEAKAPNKAVFFDDVIAKSFYWCRYEGKKEDNDVESKQENGGVVGQSRTSLYGLKRK